jgi:acyl dehydratase
VPRPAPRGLLFEEFRTGSVYMTGKRRISRRMIAEFAALTGDDNPLHTDLENSRATPFGDLIAHGLLIQSCALGLVAELGLMAGTTVALLGFDARFLRAVLPDDEIRVRLTITRKRRTSRGDRGVIYRRLEVLNQRDEIVATARSPVMVRAADRR